MALAVLHSHALTGMEAAAVQVEVHLAPGLPAFTLVGLAEAEVREARDRVRAAIQNCRFEFPPRRITVNLAPADLPKPGAFKTAGSTADAPAEIEAPAAEAPAAEGEA